MVALRRAVRSAAVQLGLPDAEAADLVQDVFVILVVQLPLFVHNPERRFRGWLWTVQLWDLEGKPSS